MADEDAVWFELGTLPIPLHVNDVAQLRELFQHKGWKVWMKIKRAVASAAGTRGLDLSKPEEQRIQDRAIFKGAANDLCFENWLEHNLEDREGMKREDLTMSYKPTLLDMLAENKS